MLAGIDYTVFDGNASLDIAAMIYDTTTGTPSLVETTALGHVVNGTYFLSYDFDDAKSYLVNTMVYTDGTFVTPDTNYSPSSKTVGFDSRITSIKTKTDNIPAAPAGTGIKKNTALPDFQFVMLNAIDQTPLAALSVAGRVSIDGAAFDFVDNAIVEIGGGWYKVDLTSADMNGKTIALSFTAMGANETAITIVTEV